MTLGVNRYEGTTLVIVVPFGVYFSPCLFLKEPDSILYQFGNQPLALLELRSPVPHLTYFASPLVGYQISPGKVYLSVSRC